MPPPGRLGRLRSRLETEPLRLLTCISGEADRCAESTLPLSQPRCTRNGQTELALVLDVTRMGVRLQHQLGLDAPVVRSPLLVRCRLAVAVGRSLMG